MNAPEHNPHLQKLDQLEAIKRKWQESEQLLNFLRTETDQPKKSLKEEELLEWNKHLH